MFVHLSKIEFAMQNWKRIGMYEVSDDGQVFSHYSNKVLKARKTKFGYYQVCLCKNGKQNFFYVHRLVYEAFCGKIPDGMVIDHINTIRDDNRLENLRCVTPYENNHNQITKKKRLYSFKKRSENEVWRVEHAERMKKRSETKEWKDNNLKLIKTKIMKPVFQIDRNTGCIIKEYESGLDAYRQTDVHFSNISACCRGKLKSAGGYIWKYA